ncbi:hypothetical protein BKA81DRAFT_378449 [Phyllosticta paracitricarpa]
MAPAYPDDQYMGWSESAMNGVSAYPEGSLYDANVLSSLQNGVYPDGQVSSTQLVRRPNNHQLTTRDFGGYGHLSQNGWQEEEEEDLEAMALKAKKEAQAKRKQIPPFVQKLSSFLDNSNHTDLIRWSDDGNSFIVLDEDEFAKTLIPELFKHNNYASFVRQLNMYGFHKKVGLSDNSMKQAERRDKKTPSEYFNKYFKRGRPELLWLIQKPKNPHSGAKRKRDEDKKPDSDEEGRKLEGEGLDNQEMQLIPKTEYNSMRNEIRQLQQQQKLISGIIQQMRRQNEQWYQQASQFQKMHERHENSINAILTFLATFYNRSLEGQSGVNMNIADMFPQSISQTNQNQGSVVDMGDFQEVEVPKNTPVPRPNKRPLALLPPPAATEKSPSPRISPANGSSRPSASPKSQSTRTPSFYKKQQQQQQQQQQHGSRLSASPQTPLENQFSSATASPAIKAETPPSLQIPGTSDDMMSVINSVNASSNTSNGPQFDFPAALSHFQTADGNTPLTQQQREDMLSLMNAASPGLNGEHNNALMNPNPPPMPSLEHFGAHQEQLDVLQRLQEEQNARVQNLSERLAPMSPHGSIPGLASYDASLNGQGNAPPSDFDLDSYIDTDADNYFGDTTSANNGTNFTPLPNDENSDFDFGSFGADLTGAQHQDASLFGTDSPSDMAQNGGGVVESIPSEGATPPETEVVNGDKEPAEPKSPRKKRKTG